MHASPLCLTVHWGMKLWKGFADERHGGGGTQKSVLEDEGDVSGSKVNCLIQSCLDDQGRNGSSDGECQQGAKQH